MSNTTNILINNQKARKYDIHERIYKFVINVIMMTNILPKTSTNLVIINQIIRSVTSMGANDQEADGTLTRKDFTHCYIIVRKESKETVFWLSLIADANPTLRLRLEVLIKEGQEIVAIISSIINKTKI
jgi:four helix bundle protein